MSTDYNSKLIASLYEKTDEEEASEIADEMVEINDAIFIQPIYSAYKRFKNGYMSHYFVSDLATFKTPEATDILKKIAMDETARSADFGYCLRNFIETEIFEQQIIDKTTTLAISQIISKSADPYTVEGYLEYLSKAKPPIFLTEVMKIAFEDEETKNDLKTVVLRYLLKENAKEHLQYYLDNFNSIKGKRSEIVLAKTITGWIGTIVALLKKKIIEEGSSRAREIIEAQSEKEKKKILKKKKVMKLNIIILKLLMKLRS